MAEVSEYCALQVAEQWDLYRTNEQDYVAVQLADDRHLYAISRLIPDSSTYHVDAESWTCTCHFNVIGDLPCRHMIHIARDRLRLDRFPPEAVKSRWRMANAQEILLPLRTSIAEIQSLRTGHLLAEAKIARMAQGDAVDSQQDVRAANRRLVQVSVSVENVHATSS